MSRSRRRSILQSLNDSTITHSANLTKRLEPRQRKLCFVRQRCDTPGTITNSTRDNEKTSREKVCNNRPPQTNLDRKTRSDQSSSQPCFRIRPLSRNAFSRSVVEKLGICVECQSAYANRAQRNVMPALGSLRGSASLKGYTKIPEAASGAFAGYLGS